jgi:hypothetical protein
MAQQPAQPPAQPPARPSIPAAAPAAPGAQAPRRAVIQVHDLTKKFGEVVGVAGISIDV